MTTEEARKIAYQYVAELIQNAKTEGIIHPEVRVELQKIRHAMAAAAGVPFTSTGEAKA